MHDPSHSKAFYTEKCKHMPCSCHMADKYLAGSCVVNQVDIALSCSEICIQTESLGAFTAGSSKHTCFLVLPDSLLEEVRLTLQGDQLHPIERVLRLEDFGVSQRCKQSVSDEFDVLRHHLAVHTDQIAWQCLTNEESLGCDCPPYEVMNHIIRKLVLQ